VLMIKGQSYCLGIRRYGCVRGQLPRVRVGKFRGGVQESGGAMSNIPEADVSVRIPGVNGIHCRSV